MAMKMIDLKNKITKRKAHIHEVDGDCCIELDMSTTLKFTNSEIKFDNPLIAASGSIGHSNEIFNGDDEFCWVAGPSCSRLGRKRITKNS